MEDDERSLRLSIAMGLYVLVENGSRKMMKVGRKSDEHWWPMDEDKTPLSMMGEDEDDDGRWTDKDHGPQPGARALNGKFGKSRKIEDERPGAIRSRRVTHKN